MLAHPLLGLRDTSCRRWPGPSAGTTATFKGCEREQAEVLPHGFSEHATGLRRSMNPSTVNLVCVRTLRTASWPGTSAAAARVIEGRPWRMSGSSAYEAAMQQAEALPRWSPATRPSPRPDWPHGA